MNIAGTLSAGRYTRKMDADKTIINWTIKPRKSDEPIVRRGQKILDSESLPSHVHSKNNIPLI